MKGTNGKDHVTEMTVRKIRATEGAAAEGADHPSEVGVRSEERGGSH